MIIGRYVIVVFCNSLYLLPYLDVCSLITEIFATFAGDILTKTYNVVKINSLVFPKQRLSLETVGVPTVEHNHCKILKLPQVTKANTFLEIRMKTAKQQTCFWPQCLFIISTPQH